MPRRGLGLYLDKANTNGAEYKVASEQAFHQGMVWRFLSTFTSTRSALSALSSSLARKDDHAASCTDLASIPPAKPFTLKSSTAIRPEWFTSLRDSLC